MQAAQQLPSRVPVPFYNDRVRQNVNCQMRGIKTGDGGMISIRSSSSISSASDENPAQRSRAAESGRMAAILTLVDFA